MQNVVSLCLYDAMSDVDTGSMSGMRFGVEPQKASKLRSAEAVCLVDPGAYVISSSLSSSRISSVLPARGVCGEQFAQRARSYR